MQAVLMALGLIAALAAGVEGVNQATGGDLNISALEKMSVAQVLETVPTRSELIPLPLAPMMEPAPAIMPVSPTMPTGDGSVPPPPMRPIMSPPPDQPGTRDFSKELPPMPPTGTDGTRPNQPPMPPREKGSEKQRPPMIEGSQNFEGGEGEFEQAPQVNPQEVKRVLREVNQMERELRRFTAQLRRLKNAGDEQNAVNELLTSLGNIKTALQSGSLDSDEVTKALEEFYGNNYREQVQILRMKIELPREIQQITKALTRAEKVVVQKAAQSLGLDLERAKNTLAEMRQRLNEISSNYQSGNMEDAMEALQDFRGGDGPMDIENTVFRVRELTRQLKRVKNGGSEELKNLLQEAIQLFNNGEYREARIALEQKNRNALKQ